MIPLVEFLVRDDEYSHGGFVERWQSERAETARERPGRKRDSTSVPTNPDDGVLELAFEDGRAMNEAFEADAGEDAQADAAEFTDPGAGLRMIVEETVHVGADR